MSASVETRVANVIAGVMGIPVERLTANPNSSLVEELGLDSQGAVLLLLGLEKEFKIKIPAERMSELLSVGSIAAALDDLISHPQGSSAAG